MTDSTSDAYVTDRPAFRPKPAAHVLRDTLAVLASLKITVVLFALSAVLVFLGTLAMKDWGTWTVVKTYFRSFYLWIPFQVFVRLGQVFFGVKEGVAVPGGFPFPGGWSIGAALLVNLISAHVVRFKISWRRSGILLLHTGVAILLVSELVTGLFAVEGNMVISQGETVNYVLSSQKTELAIIDATDPAGDNIVAIPATLLRKGEAIHDDALPFDVRGVRYLVNSDLVDLPATGGQNPATAGAGLRTAVAERAEVVGVDADQRNDIPSAFIALHDETDRQRHWHLPRLVPPSATNS